MRTIFCFLFTLLSFINTAYAANGYKLIGQTPTSLALGGSGVAHVSDAHTMLAKNPALLGYHHRETGKHHFGFSLSTLFLNAEAQNAGLSDETFESSEIRFIPNFSYVYHHNKRWSLGIGHYGEGGNATDFADSAILQRIAIDYKYSNLKASLVYRFPKVSFSVSPRLLLSSLSINYDSGTGTQSDRDADMKAFWGGFDFGAAFQIHDKAFLAINFSTGVDNHHRDVADLEFFLGAPHSTLDNLELSSPSEFAAGFAFEPAKNWHINFDYRLIDWQHTKVFGDLGWRTQHVLASGIQWHAMETLALRFGVNYSRSPIRPHGNEVGHNSVPIGSTAISQQAASLFNVAGIPAHMKWTIGMGFEYEAVKNLKINFAYNYATKQDIQRAGNTFNPATSSLVPYDLNGESNLHLVSLGASYSF